MNSPLDAMILFHVGPVPISRAVVVTWVIMAVLVLGAFLLTRRLTLKPGKLQAAIELIVATVDIQIRETTGAGPEPIAPSSVRCSCSFWPPTGPPCFPGSNLRPPSLRPMPLWRCWSSFL